jgi:putative transposase
VAKVHYLVYIKSTYKEDNKGSQRITLQQVHIIVQAKAAELGDESYPNYRTVDRVMGPIIEEQEQKTSVRNFAWRGSRLSLKTRDGLNLSVE